MIWMVRMSIKSGVGLWTWEYQSPKSQALKRATTKIKVYVRNRIVQI